MSDETSNFVGRKVGGYDVIKLLREGAMAQIYLARQSTLGITRVVKVMRGQAQDNAIALARFRREAQVLSRLHHHHVVQIIDFGEHNNDAYLVMEYIEGVDLSELVAESGPLALGAALGILRDVAEALRYAHTEGVLHRDLKPANIVARASDTSQTKLIDFGLARLSEELKATKLTHDNAVLGSPQYMSPEQAQAHGDLTGAIDVYALAGLAYFLVSGGPVFPFSDYSTVVDVLRAHCVVPPIELSLRCRALGIDTEVPEALDRLLLGCLAKNPRHRPSSEEVASHLDRLYVTEMARRPPSKQNAERSKVAGVIAFEENLAETVWQNLGVSPIGVSPVSPAKRQQLGAIQQKAEQALLALSSELVESSAGTSRIEQQLSDVQQSLDRLETLGLQRALLESENADDKFSCSQRNEARAQVEELEGSLRNQFQKLYSAAMQDLSETNSKSDLRDALRVLVDSHRGLSECE